MTRKEMYEFRLTIVHQMHEYIMNTGDDDIIEIWFRDCIPDCPSEEDFEYFAKDVSEFRTLCDFFGRLVFCDEKENY